MPFLHHVPSSPTVLIKVIDVNCTAIDNSRLNLLTDSSCFINIALLGRIKKYTLECAQLYYTYLAAIFDGLMDLLQSNRSLDG